MKKYVFHSPVPTAAWAALTMYPSTWISPSNSFQYKMLALNLVFSAHWVDYTRWHNYHRQNDKTTWGATTRLSISVLEKWTRLSSDNLAYGARFFSAKYKSNSVDILQHRSVLRKQTTFKNATKTENLDYWKGWTASRIEMQYFFILTYYGNLDTDFVSSGHLQHQQYR